MPTFRPPLHLLLLCFLALLLNGCGGGGSGGTGGSTGGGGSGGSTGGSGGSTGTQTVTIGGSVSGLTSGQSVTLEINGGSAQVVQGLASGASVSFSFPSVSLGSTYTVTVSNDPAGFLCPVSNGAGTASANVNDVAVSCHTPTLTTLYSFFGTINSAVNGSQPLAGLLMDSQGNLFGTTYGGGSNNDGTVFELKSTGSGTWATTITTLYSFTGGADGSAPQATLLMDSHGNLFGTTSSSGSSGKGTVFELKSTGSGTWATTLTTLYAFTGNGTDGANSYAGLIMDSSGNLFGTTASGGSSGEGTVFELKSTGSGTWATTATTLYSFSGGADGANPEAPLLLDSQGDLLGTTYAGGDYGNGALFELKSTGTGTWATTSTTLFDFTGIAPYGGKPFYASLTMDDQGDLFGVTNQGGVNGVGLLFELKSTGFGTWATTPTVLYSFSGVGADGARPFAAPIIDSAGNLFGTTINGGTSGDGTVFELASTGPGTWATTATTLYSFTGATDGSLPYAPLIMDSQGDLFGMTSGGTLHTVYGTVYELH